MIPGDFAPVEFHVPLSSSRVEPAEERFDARNNQGDPAAMPEAQLGGRRLACLVILSALTLLPGLGSSGRLTYHEAFVAQGAREILHSGEWGYPTIGGLPWLEKPPLPWWLVAMLGHCAGEVTETMARLPSALAALGLVLGVAVLATRHYGPGIGLLAGAVQSTTAWTVMRGRLAEADILLTCLITWAIVAFDRIQNDAKARAGQAPCHLAPRWHFARWAFFALWGATALVKGIGFGAVLILAVAAGVLLWQRDGTTLRRLQFPAGWILAAIIALAWPVLMLARHGNAAFTLWSMHVADRLIGQKGPGPFAGEPWWEYVPALLTQALPWTPLALWGAWHSLGRAWWRGGGGISTSTRYGTAVPVPPEVIGGDRLLWVWTVAPLSLLALATVRNAHYALSAQVPWSIWAALALARLGGRLRGRGGHRNTLLLMTRAGFTTLALVYGLGIWLLGPWFDRRGVEWAFYESAGRQCPSGMSLALLYDDWDRNPYDSPFGLIPHDLAVRLFYLNRPACWHIGTDSLSTQEHHAGQCSHGRYGSSTGAIPAGAPESVSTDAPGSPLAVIGRDRDRLALEQLGDVEVIAHGPSFRRDRSYALFRITPSPVAGRISERVQARTKF
jgi:4-amino-4-deoxy-L-arabinose transferase-like glycosyltransferase